MLYNENTRVKIPSLIHLTRLGYKYLSLKNRPNINPANNIFTDLLSESLYKINKTINEELIKETLNEINLVLENEDLGKSFYSLLCNGYKGIKIIDFDNLENNTFHVVTELTYRNNGEEFRPDITILINGLPLSFIEVKKPNNKDGIQAERKRMDIRFQNKHFRKFINITQLMIFSNNAEYDDNEDTPLEGAFYTTCSDKSLTLNHFREEYEKIFTEIDETNPETEKFILKDNNLQSIKSSPEYYENINPCSPTNRIITSLLSKNRLFIMLKYGITYVKKVNKNSVEYTEKHIMRYPQLFATLAIEKTLEKGLSKGIIWHTQGSGKTALSYFNVKYLKDYYQRKGIIAKFYFIVDRLDLLTQASTEFRARGLEVAEIDSKENFIEHLSSISSPSVTGKDSITVVNIQKFSKETIDTISDYSVNIQKIYFIDEAHRSYSRSGSFLSSLTQSDKKAIKIALTGTPLIGAIYDEYGQITNDKYNSKDIFGDYIHKYYYNKSIIDGYTLRLIREGIQTEYREKLADIFKEVSIFPSSLKKNDVYAHPKYVSALVQYIANDYRESLVRMGDTSMRAMIVCDSSDQARAIYTKMQKTKFSSALILHDEGDTNTRRALREDFKKGDIDFLIVYNMLLTGFDAPRLKKLYLGRIIKDHSLLQALTRVNRPYNSFKYGYVVDFANINKEFDKTNKAYFDELQIELGDAYGEYSNLFKSTDEIEEELNNIKDILWKYDTNNVEIFSKQINIADKSTLIELRKALTSYKELHNTIHTCDYLELLEKFDLEKITSLYSEVNNRIGMLNAKDNLLHAEDMQTIINTALEQIEFKFTKRSEKEMVIADKFQELLQTTRQELAKNSDRKDPEYITLLEALRKIFQKKNIEELTTDEINETTLLLIDIKKTAEQQNQQNTMISSKYNYDNKFIRVHKNIKKLINTLTDRALNTILLQIKEQLDDIISNNENILDNDVYFKATTTPLIKTELDKNKVDVTLGLLEDCSLLIATEYLNEKEGNNNEYL